MYTVDSGVYPKLIGLMFRTVSVPISMHPEIVQSAKHNKYTGGATYNRF